MLSKGALQGENADSKVATHVNQSRFERPQGGRGYCVPSNAVVTRGAVEMKPAAVVCVLALVLVLTAAESAAPDGLRGSSGVGSVVARRINCSRRPAYSLFSVVDIAVWAPPLAQTDDPAPAGRLWA